MMGDVQVNEDEFAFQVQKYLGMSMCNRRREKRKVEGSRKIITAQRTKEQNSWVNLKTIHFASDDLPSMNFSRRYTTQD